MAASIGEPFIDPSGKEHVMRIDFGRIVIIACAYLVILAAEPDAQAY